jgi:hypothetical protein
MISFEEFMSKSSKIGFDKVTEGLVDAIKNESEDSVKESIERLVESVKEETVEIEDHKNTEPTKEAVIVEDNGYKLYRDKAEAFVCDMEISGASTSSSKARIIIESENLTYMFEGSIDETGKCKIPLKKMNFLQENERGNIKLEVIAEDTVFTPWQDNFVAVSSKKVAVKVIESRDSSSGLGIKVSNIR